jgi:hypothetical protein
MFFIGDGLTGVGTGSVQAFFIPVGATLRYLGIPDQCESYDPTGCHADNSGVLMRRRSVNALVTRGRIGNSDCT